MKTATLKGRKPRMGRPPMNGIRMTVTSFDIPIWDLLQMRRKAKAMGVSTAEFMRRAVLAALEALP